MKESNNSQPRRGRVVTVGTFDGYHRGHAEVVACVHAIAAERDLSPMVITFDRHPLEVVAPERAPRMIMDPDRRDSLLREAGMRVERIAFTREVMGTTAREWMEIMVRRYDAKVIVLGYDNTFGRDGAKLQPADFQRYGEELGIEVVVAPRVEGCSSSAVRRLIAEGRIGEANDILGRRFCLSGIVEHGRGFGHTIGVPTANISLAGRQLLPLSGVYVAEAEIDGKSSTAVVNIGRCPTVTDGTRLTVEANLLDFNDEIYGRQLSLYIIERLRDERKFDSLDSLRRQIAQDITQARTIAATH